MLFTYTNDVIQICYNTAKEILLHITAYRVKCKQTSQWRKKRQKEEANIRYRNLSKYFKVFFIYSMISKCMIDQNIKIGSMA